MSAQLGQLVVNLEANIARFTSDMGRASQTVEQTMGRMNAAADVVKGVLGAVGVALSVDVLISETNRAIGALADLDDMAQKTGSSVETLSKLSKVAAFTGTEFGAVDSMVVKLSKSLNDVDEKGSKTAKALGAIGISVADIKDMDPAQVFVEITRKLQDYEDGGGKIALVNDLMGKSAADMLPYMNDVAESIDQFTGDSAEAAAQAANYQNELGLLKVKYDEMVTSIVSGALPATNAFIGALQDTLRESDKLANDKNLTSWADHAGLVLARMADGGALVGRTFKAVGAELAATSANFDLMNAVMANSNPLGAAKVLAAGGSPTENIKAALAKRNEIIAQANTMVSGLWTQPLDAMEQAYVKRLSESKNTAGLNALGSAVGLGDISPGKKVNYSGGEPQPTAASGKGGKTAVAPVVDLAPAIARMRDLGPDENMAARMVELANDETLAMRGTIDVTNDLVEADMRRFEQKMRTAAQITAGAENIRLSLMTDVEAEQFEHERAIEQLQAFGALKLENEMTANALIEAETARHVQAKADMERMHHLQALGMAGNSADQLYNLLQQAGMEQTALGKALFIANKAIAVAEIIMNTELGAAKALAMGPVVGPPLAMAIRVMGYASAGLTAGIAIASAEGGYDIPAGTNPVTQLHEKEMVLPKAQAEVIRGLAANGGGAGMKVTIVNQTTGRIDNVIEKQISPTERALIIQEAVAATASTLSDPNSKMSRSMARNLNVARTRS